MWISSYDTWSSNARRKFGHETIKYTANPAEESLAKGVPQSYFTSHYMLDMGATGAFEVAQFHIHHKSEHTVEGEQMDLEMHWVHFADGLGEGNIHEMNDNDYAIASALGIMFSLDAKVEPQLRYTTYEFLDWIMNDLENDTNGASEADKSGVAPKMDKLLHAVNWNNRWSYSGSLTTPPCTTSV
jgi:carbonic anhydrase